MNNQFKLFAANVVLAAVTFFAVGAAHADTAVAPKGSSIKAAVVQYLAKVGEQTSEAYHAAR